MPPVVAVRKHRPSPVGGKFVPRAPSDLETSPPQSSPVAKKTVPRKVSPLSRMPHDNFSAIAPCSHIVPILLSSAKDTVITTYRQAVAISLAFLDDKIYISKKDGSVVPHLRLSARRTQALRCLDCEIGDFHGNFICLQCPHVGCIGDERNHAHSHYTLTLHIFSIDSRSGLLYCFLCQSFTNHPSLNKIRLEVMGVSSVPVPTENTPADLHFSTPTALMRSGLRGFVNLGSTCYMSSILQTFIHNPLVKYRFFNNDEHYFECENGHSQALSGNQIDASNACISCSLDHIYLSFYTSDSNEGFGMANLLTTAWYKNNLLAGYQEQDAHEFWQFLLNELHSDHEQIANRNGSSSDRCTCIAHEIFCGELQSCITCQSCESVTTKIDPMMDISLEIGLHRKQGLGSSNINLYDCLDAYTRQENLDEKYLCQYCGVKSAAHKSMSIKSLPPTLAIQLKRFKHDHLSEVSSKLETPVQMPLYLNMTKYANEINDDTGRAIDGNMVYELFAVVCHMGSVNTGHYVVYIKNGAGQWLLFDDSVVSRATESEVLASSAYLLFYMVHKI